MFFVWGLSAACHCYQFDFGRILFAITFASGGRLRVRPSNVLFAWGHLQKATDADRRLITGRSLPTQFQSNHALAALALTRTLTPPLNYQPTTMTCDHSALGHRPPIPNGNNNLSPRLESGNNLSRQSGAKESSPFSILHSVAMTLEHARFFIHIVCTLHILRKNN